MNPNFEDLRWLAGSLSVGVASGIMVLTGTVHPPAGATALLAAVDTHVSGLGWLLLPIVLISSMLTTAVACIFNNIHRQYPQYWWSPNKPSATAKEDEEKGQKNRKTPEMQMNAHHTAQRHSNFEIIVSASGIDFPPRLYLSEEEHGMLKILEQRLNEVKANEEASQSDTHSDTHTSEHDKSDKDSF